MNSGGWGLRLMIFWMGVMIIALIVSAIIINKLGNNLFNSNNNSPNNNPNPNHYYEPPVEKLSYSSLESKLEEKCIKYVNDYYMDLPVGDNIQVPVKVLIGKGYLETVYDIKDKSLACSGYVDVKHKETGFEYTPYLKCGNNYKTKGYLDRLDS